MYKPRTIGQYRVMEFLKAQFHLDSFLVWPISRDALLLEDRDDEQIAFVSTEDGIAECEVPPPGTSADLRLFHEYLNGKYPKPEQQTFDAKTRLWLESPIPISFAQALGLTDELFRHYLSHPMIDEEEMRRQIVTGSVSIGMYQSMQLWYLDGHVKDTLLLIAGVDGIGPYADLIFHYRTPFAESHQFYILGD